MATGSCLCGSVTFEVNGPLRDIIYCHCNQCRKQTGHFVAATSAEDAHLVVKGDENLTWFEASETAKRGFCKKCGSLMFWKNYGQSKTSIMAGVVETRGVLNASRHIFASDKGDYYEICDGLPVFDAAD